MRMTEGRVGRLPTVQVCDTLQQVVAQRQQAVILSNHRKFHRGRLAGGLRRSCVGELVQQAVNRVVGLML